MDIVNSLLMTVVNPILGNPALQAAALGLAVKWVTDQVKKLLVQVDANGVPDGYKVPVQLLVTIFSFLAAVGTLALQGKLATLDLVAVGNFLTVALPTAISAMGIQKIGNIVLKKE